MEFIIVTAILIPALVLWAWLTLPPGTTPAIPTVEDYTQPTMTDEQKAAGREQCDREGHHIPVRWEKVIKIGPHPTTDIDCSRTWCSRCGIGLTP